MQRGGLPISSLRRCRAEGAGVRYGVVAEAYRDLEGASGRLQLIDRLAELVRQTPAELLPTVALLCQGQIAPDFAGVELGVAERLPGELDPDRPATLEVGTVFDGLHEIARADGEGSQGRKLAGLTDLLGQATPLEARYLVRTVTGSLRLGIGTATILDALAEVHAGGRKQRL